MKDNDDLFRWHKYPEEEPPKTRPLLVIYDRMSRISGVLKHDMYQTTLFSIIGKKTPFGAEGYKIKYWAYVPELPEEVKRDKSLWRRK